MRCHLLKIIGIVALFVVGANAGWVKQNSGSLAWLRDVHFFDDEAGVAVGSGGTYLETSDGGKTWQKKASFTTDSIRQIFFAGRTNGWLLCERDVFNRGGSSVSYLLRTSDGGESWERIEFAELGRARITRIFFNSKGMGYAVGEGGTIYAEQPDGKWLRQATPFRFLLLDGKFHGATGAIVGAGGSVYFSDDDGASWIGANVFGDRTAKLGSVFFLDQRNAWAVGSGGKIFQSFSGGKTWREQTSGVAVNLADVAFRSTAEGWATGEQGVMLRTKTGGNVWYAEETPVRHRLERLAVTNKTAVAVGFGGTILRYDENAVPVKSGSRPTLQKRN